MVDLTDQEQAAIRAAMKLIAELMDEIGWDKRLADLSEVQVLSLIEAAVEGFQDAMRESAASDSMEIPF
jgi:hypothetical protein